MAMPRRGRVRGEAADRRARIRRKRDLYRELGKMAGLVASASAAVVGQAELIGEPWRHYLAVTAIATTAIWAYCMRPNNLGKLIASVRGGKGR